MLIATAPRGAGRHPGALSSAAEGRAWAILAELLIILALVLLNGLFAGAEIAVLSVRKTRLGELVEEDRAGARAVQWLREQPERFLATVQVGITIVGTTAAAFGGDRMADDLAPALAHVPGVGPHAHQLALALVVAMVSFLSLILGELVPKSLALRAAESYALLIGRPLRMLARAARPLVWLLTASSNAVLRLFGDKTSFTEARLSPEELQELVEEAARAGALDARTSEIASRALEFRDLSAAAVMVPRTEIVAWPVDASPDRLQTLAEETRHARVPVYEGTIDNVVGYVALREMLAIAMRGEALSLRRVMRPVHFVPATIRAVDLLKALQAQRVPLAIVVDEVGGVAGLVTMEDLAEELIGEFIGEHEPPPMAMEPAADGTLMVQGTTPVREVNRALSLELPEGEGWTTLAGLCIHLAGRIPQSGTRITAPDGTVLEVVEASSRRVRSVRVHPRRPDPDAR